MEIDYRPLRVEESSKACQLMNAAYARQKIPAYFKWLYFDCPLPAKLHGAFYKNTLIGMAGIVQRSLTNGSTVGVIMDVIVDQKFRNQGIFSTLISKLQHDFPLDMYCSFTNYAGMSAFTKGLDWKKVCKIDVLMYDSALVNESIPQPKNPSSVQVSDEFKITSEYLRWRFDKSPLYDYSVHQNPKGVVITKVFVDPVTKASFGDLVYLKPVNNTCEEVTYLLTASLKHFQQSKIENLTTWALPQTPLFQICVTSNWKQIPQERYLCVNIINQNYNSLLESNAWNIFQADSEVF